MPLKRESHAVDAFCLRFTMSPVKDVVGTTPVGTLECLKFFSYLFLVVLYSAKIPCIYSAATALCSDGVTHCI